MRGYLICKIAQAFLTLLFVLVFNFFLFRVMPGDPAAILLRGTAAFNPETLEAAREELGLAPPPAPAVRDVPGRRGHVQLRSLVLPERPTGERGHLAHGLAHDPAG